MDGTEVESVDVALTVVAVGSVEVVVVVLEVEVGSVTGVVVGSVTDEVVVGAVVLVVVLESVITGAVVVLVVVVGGGSVTGMTGVGSVTTVVGTSALGAGVTPSSGGAGVPIWMICVGAPRVATSAVLAAAFSALATSDGTGTAEGSTSWVSGVTDFVDFGSTCVPPRSCVLIAARSRASSSFHFNSRLFDMPSAGTLTM